MSGRERRGRLSTLRGRRRCGRRGAYFLVRLEDRQVFLGRAAATAGGPEGSGAGRLCSWLRCFAVLWRPKIRWRLSEWGVGERGDGLFGGTGLDERFPASAGRGICGGAVSPWLWNHIVLLKKNWCNVKWKGYYIIFWSRGDNMHSNKIYYTVIIYIS